MNLNKMAAAFLALLFFFAGAVGTADGQSHHPLIGSKHFAGGGIESWWDSAMLYNEGDTDYPRKFVVEKFDREIATFVPSVLRSFDKINIGGKSFSVEELQKIYNKSDATTIGTSEGRDRQIRQDLANYIVGKGVDRDTAEVFARFSLFTVQDDAFKNKTAVYCGVSLVALLVVGVGLLRYRFRGNRGKERETKL